MKAKRVLVDVDQVLCDFATPAIQYVREQFGVDLELSRLRHWDMFLTLSAEQFRAFEEDFFVEGRCASLELYPGVVEAVEAIRRHAEVVAVTSPPRYSRHWVHERTQWLISNLGFDDNAIIHTRAKHMIVGHMLVDDSPTNVTKWQEYHPRGVGLMWALPNTEHLSECEGFRVRTWDEILGRVKAL